MKKVTVKYLLTGGSECDGLLIESMDDIKLIRSEFMRSEERIIKKFIRSNEPSSRYDHVLSGLRPTEKGIATLACIKASFSGENPIYLLPNCREQAIMGMISSLTSFPEGIFINKNGGYCPLFTEIKGVRSRFLEVVKSEEFSEFESNVHYYLGSNAKYLNLENDYEIERAAVRWMESEGKGYSYITELSTLSARHLEFIMGEFKKKGGTHIYVYTTGQNVQQMYDYSASAIKVGINDFVFEFNAGIDDGINEFVLWLKSRANVRVLNNLK